MGLFSTRRYWINMKPILVPEGKQNSKSSFPNSNLTVTCSPSTTHWKPTFSLMWNVQLFCYLTIIKIVLTYWDCFLVSSFICCSSFFILFDLLLLDNTFILVDKYTINFIFLKFCLFLPICYILKNHLIKFQKHPDMI